MHLQFQPSKSYSPLPPVIAQSSSRTRLECAHLYIVEDDLAVRSALRMLALSYGWGADTYADGADFLRAELDETRGCVVLDLSMPGITGEEVLQQLRARGSRLPVLVITGDGTPARCERVIRSGAHAVLQKPFGDRAFYEAVCQCWCSAPGSAT